MSDAEHIDEGTEIAWDFALPLPESKPGDRVLVAQRAAGDDAEAQPGTTLFVASTDTPDRAMDVVKQDFKLGNYRRNPVVLNNHVSLLVVGRAASAKVPRAGDDAGKLMIRVQWDLENPDPSIRSVGHQHINGFRSAGSVGFRAGKKTRRDKLPPDHQFYQAPVEVETWWGGTVEMSGLLMEQNELLEFSSASIPMNPEALQRALSGEQHLVERLAERDIDDVAGRLGIVRQTLPVAVGADLVELVRRATPEARRELVTLLWPDLLGLYRTDETFRRIVAAFPLAGPPAPTTPTGPGLFASVLRRLKE